MTAATRLHHPNHDRPSRGVSQGIPGGLARARREQGAGAGEGVAFRTVASTGGLASSARREMA
jgi:hypothetical protein